jgi:hypothetical protein
LGKITTFLDQQKRIDKEQIELKRDKHKQSNTSIAVSAPWHFWLFLGARRDRVDEVLIFHQPGLFLLHLVLGIIRDSYYLSSYATSVPLASD